MSGALRLFEAHLATNALRDENALLTKTLSLESRSYLLGIECLMNADLEEI